MTCSTYGIRFMATVGGLLGLGVLAAAGCTQEERTTTARSAAQSASASVISTATGQSATPTTPRPSRPRPGLVKLNGRGGFDASEAQKAALARAHYMRDHHNDVMKPFHPTSQPTTQPTTTQPTTNR